VEEQSTRQRAVPVERNREAAAVPQEESLAERAVLGDARDAVSDAQDQIDQSAEHAQTARADHERSRHASQRQQASLDREAAVTDLAAADAELAGLREALATRAVIGQAVGLTMASQQIDADTAFAHLVRRSQSEHVKIRDLAPEVVAEALRSWAASAAGE
jgi:uncharacterized protein YlxW (UPF0749 family)